MSHCAMTPRAGFGSAVWARAQRRAVAEEVRRGCKVGAMGCGGILQDPAARRATVDGHVRGRNGPDAAKIRHAMKVVDFGARF